MLSIHALRDAKGAGSYYEDDNYYAQDDLESKQNSEWYGAGARYFGIEGEEVDKARFVNCLEGHFDDVRLGRLEKKNDREIWKHKPGWDLTFSAPKSVSILTELNEDKALLAAHKKAVHAALNYVEATQAQTRATEKGSVKFTPTNNIIAATFTHNTSRELDPQLHTHSIIMNATMKDGKWRSLSSERLYDFKMKSGRVYRDELAHQLKKMGYNIRVTDKQNFLFEIEGVNQKTIDHFSQRRQQIVKTMKELGLDSAKTAAIATLDTRSKKLNVDHGVLKSTWRERSEAIGFDYKAMSKPAVAVEFDKSSASINEAIDPQKAYSLVKYTSDWLSERDASFTYEQFHQKLTEENEGVFSQDELRASTHLGFKNELLKRVEIDQGVSMITTKKSRQLEQSNIRLLNGTKDSVKSILSPDKAQIKITKAKKKLENLDSKIRLTKGQLNAAYLPLTTTDRVVAIQGRAGTGKTTGVSLLKSLVEKEGYTVSAFAPSGAAANVLSDELSLKANTVDQLLIDVKRDQVNANSGKHIWIVDEAGMLSSRHMNGLLSAAEKHNARLVLLGDSAQLESVEAGRPFDQLQKAGMKTVEMKDILRQKTPELKDAVIGALEKNIEKALLKVGKNIYQEGKEENYTKMVNYLFNDNGYRDDTMLIAPANEDRHRLNAMVRSRLVQSSALSDRSVQSHSFENRDMRAIELSRAKSFREKDVIRFGRTYKSIGVVRDEYFHVLSKDEVKNEIKIQSLNDDRVITVNPSEIGGEKKAAIEVYSVVKAELREGDELRWRRNNKEFGFTNGEKFTVSKIKGDKITIKTERNEKFTFKSDDVRFKHFDYAYVDTAYSAQGQTKDRVAVLLESWRRNLVNQKSLYVGISRAKHEAAIFTDDRNKLADALKMRVGENSTALNNSELFNKDLTKQKGRSLSILL